MTRRSAGAAVGAVSEFQAGGRRLVTTVDEQILKGARREADCSWSRLEMEEAPPEAGITNELPMSLTPTRVGPSLQMARSVTLITPA